MKKAIFEELCDQSLLTEQSVANIRQYQRKPVISLFWELRTLLYLGIILLTSGLGVLVYQNIDTIGHKVILALIAAITTGCFYWCNKDKLPFSTAKVESPDAFFDYILLLGTLSFLIFTGYLQYQYEVFGTHYGLATFIPTLVLFFLAYYFDHRGILSMAIANLAIWMGVTVTPKELLEKVDFNDEAFLYTYLALGAILLLAAYLTDSANFKKHFFFSYHHYGVHLTFIALLSGYFYYDYGVSFAWLLAFSILAVYIYKRAFQNHSFYFLMITVLYAYVASGGLIVRSVMKLEEGEGLMVLVLMYFVGTGIALIMYLMDANKKIKH